VEVSQFFHLEGSFFCHIFGNALTTEKDMSRRLDFLCDFIAFIVYSIQSFLEIGRKHLEFIDNLASHLLCSIEVFVLCEPQRHHRQRRNLTNICLSTGNRELSAAVEEDTTVVFTCKS